MTAMTASRNYGTIAQAPDQRVRMDYVDAHEIEQQYEPGRHNTQQSSAWRMFSTLLFVGMFVLAAAGYLASSTLFEHTHASALHAAASSNIARATGKAPPMQVHLALADSDRVNSGSRRVGITVSWATGMQTRTSSVRFGTIADTLKMTAYNDTPSEQYDFCDYTSPWFHHVIVPSSQLEPSTTYYYQCGDDEGGWSDVASFRTPVAIGSQTPVTIGVVGDLGQTKYSKQTLRHLEGRSDLSAIIHAGDLSYADSDQLRWDSWGNLVQPLSSSVPSMVSVGNHEKEGPCQRDVDPFVAYQVRFRMPYDPADALQRRNLFYAFRVGMVHMVVLNPYVAFDTASDQYKWLESELSTRIDRSVTPWVVVLMHGPWYNSNTAHQGMEEHVVMKRAMENLLFRHEVDLVLSGHVHAYERSYPVYKEQVRKDGIIYVTLGGGGNREGLASRFIKPQPAWSAVRQAHYGFGLFKAVNSTHGVIESYENREHGDARLADSAWITTTMHRVKNDLVDDAAAK